MTSKLYFILLFSSVAFPVYCQHENLNQKHKWGCSSVINSIEAQVGDPEKASWGYAYLNMFQNFNDKTNNSLSLSIIPKYFISDNLVLRFEFGVTNINMKSYFDSNDKNNATTFHSILIENIKQKIYRFIPGIQYNVLKKKSFEFFCGTTVSYFDYSAMEYTAHFEDRNLPNNTLVSVSDDKATGTKGFAAGIGAFLGGNVYLHNRISLGVEFSSALLYYKIGGEWGGESVHQNFPSPPTTYAYKYSNSSYKGIQFSKILSSFNISFWL
ncbi:MAG: hypothetical protein K8R85_00470 [Bacteroidetes bacterium]|nr:hypothetical protein [Bacteroidota bacterium]